MHLWKKISNKNFYFTVVRHKKPDIQLLDADSIRSVHLQENILQNVQNNIPISTQKVGEQENIYVCQNFHNSGRIRLITINLPNFSGNTENWWMVMVNMMTCYSSNFKSDEHVDEKFASAGIRTQNFWLTQSTFDQRSYRRTKFNKAAVKTCYTIISCWTSKTARFFCLDF